MRTILLCTLGLSLTAVGLAPEPKPADPIERLAPHAASICLAEVVSRRTYDNRGSDGNAGVTFQLKVLRGSGVTGPEVEIRKVTGYGGLRAPGSRAPQVTGPVETDSFKPHERYWIAFCSQHERDKYPQGVIAFWPEGDAKVAPVMEDAVKTDRYRWTPQYEPVSHMTWEVVRDPEKPSVWQLRATRDGEKVWEKTVPGRLTRHFITYEDNRPRGKRSDGPPGVSGLLIRCENEVTLSEPNEYGLPPGQYGINTRYELDTGVRVDDQIFGGVKEGSRELNRSYDAKTGGLKLETTVVWLPTGGIAAGVKQERWGKKVVRTFDPATGKELSSQAYRNDPDAKDWTRQWVPMADSPAARP